MRGWPVKTSEIDREVWALDGAGWLDNMVISLIDPPEIWILSGYKFLIQTDQGYLAGPYRGWKKSPAIGGLSHYLETFNHPLVLQTGLLGAIDAQL